jgi:cytidylate kinase
MTGFVVAIDGPAASGKGSIATFLGGRLRLPVLDTGLLYRAVGAVVANAGDDLDDAAAAGAAALKLDLDTLGAPSLRTRAAGEAASRVAVHASVRSALLEAQRAFARRPGGAILDGRDIGTVVAPEAPCKLFVTASPEARAGRRHAQLRAQGESVALNDVLDDIRRRDARDGDRSAAPMKRALDAALLDTTDLDINAAFDAALRIVEASRDRWEKS